MGWKPIKGYNDLDDLLGRVKQIETHCEASAKPSTDHYIDAGNSRRYEIIRLYSAAEAILDKLENGSSRHRLLERVKVEELLDQIKAEISKLGKAQRSIPGFNKLSLSNKGTASMENDIDELKKEFVDTIQARLNKMSVTEESSSLLSTSLNDFLSRMDTRNKSTTVDHIPKIEREKLSDWNQANSRIDSHVIEIGDAALKIADKAELLTHEARRQDADIREIKTLAEFTTNDITRTSRKVQEVIGTNNNATFCCRILLSTLIFVSISIITALTLKELT